jgi:hypothetical protein
MRKLLLLIAIAGAGCTRANPLTLPGPDGGGGGPCSAHTDAASCNADSACLAVGCPDCFGGQSFVGCFDKNSPPPLHCATPSCSCHGLAEQECRAAASHGCVTATCCGAFQGCLDPTDPPMICAADCVQKCPGLDEKTCQMTAGCRADYCPACSPGSTYFANCSDAALPPAQCQPLPCPPPQTCDQVTTLADCDARSDCHSVFEPGACGCAFCCCTFFSRCADGAFADCKGPSACNIAPPDCNNPACNGEFTVGYSNLCYEGCVRQSACAP